MDMPSKFVSIAVVSTEYGHLGQEIALDDQGRMWLWDGSLYCWREHVGTQFARHRACRREAFEQLKSQTEKYQEELRNVPTGKRYDRDRDDYAYRIKECRIRMEALLPLLPSDITVS